MTPALHELFLTHAVAAFDRQLQIADLVAGLDWQIDVPEARLTFGDRYRWAVQFLGTESNADQTWLWAWANPSGLLRHSLFSALALRDTGIRDGITEFAESLLPLAEVDGHTLAMVASRLRSSYPFTA